MAYVGVKGEYTDVFLPPTTLLPFLRWDYLMLLDLWDSLMLLGADPFIAKQLSRRSF